MDRFTFQGVDKIKVRKHSYRLVLDSPYVKDKKKCKQIINEAIYNKYVTLGIINQKFHRKNSIKFLFRSLLYKFDRKTMNILLKIVLFGKEKYVYIESKELDLM
ncbi:MAG: hypothetical protein PWQ93_1725 [Clostridiales bacterium]|nr:hypothetical protein [Clostridiales bacterium]